MAGGLLIAAAAAVD